MRFGDIVLVVLGLAGTHLGLEVTARHALPPPFDVPHLRVHAAGYQTWQPGARFRYRNLPGVTPPSALVEINELGLRDEPLALPKPAGQRRVIVVGDSNTAAMQLERDDIFTTQLQLELGDQDLRVVNAGTKGTGLAEHLLWLRHEGFRLQPDLLVVQVASDDPGDDLAHGGFRHDGVVLELAPELASPPPWREAALRLRDAIGNRSAVAYRVWSQLRAARSGGSAARPRPEGAFIPAAAAPAGAPASAPLSSRPAPTTPPRPEPAGTALSAALLQQIVREAEADDVPVLVLELPHPLFLFSQHPALAGIRRRSPELAAIRVDVRERFQQEWKAGDDPYLAGDGHLDASGHRAVADILARRIRDVLGERDVDGTG